MLRNQKLRDKTLFPHRPANIVERLIYTQQRHLPHVRNIKRYRVTYRDATKHIQFNLRTGVQNPEAVSEGGIGGQTSW
eukprot:scaffold491307_cov19-Prasinocladus_malaysianus.AAC.1